MKICVLAGANSIHSSRWVEFFARRGHELHWVSLAPFSEPAVPNVHQHELGLGPIAPLGVLKGMKELSALLRAIAPDLLHVHYLGTYGLIGALTGFHPMIATAWGSDVLVAGRSLLKRPLVKWVLQRADLITCDAEHMRQAILRFGISEQKMRIVYFGTDTTRFRPGPPSADLRRRLEVLDRPTIISLRSLEPIYDVATLVRAVPHVVARVPEAAFVIAGTGSQKEQLAGLASSLDIADHIRFCGQIPNQRLHEYLTTADVYVSTSLSDAGLAASTAEAMACGLPVVVTDSGENRLWVEDGKGGFVIPVRAPVSLAEKILHLLESASERRRLGLYNRSVIEERNNYSTEMTKVEALYRELVERRGQA